MSYRYLLDTNVVSSMIRFPRGEVFEKITQVGEGSICTSVIVACELRFGAEKKASERLKQRLEDVLRIIPVLSLSPSVESYYAQTRAFLEREGIPIGPNDLLIAAHALSLNLVVVTANVREFSRVPALEIENWIAL